MTKSKIIILDFGSQYTQVIARKIREMGVYTEVLPSATKLENILQRNTLGVILSGGPNSVYEINAPKIDKELLEHNIPILGICYGMQLISYLLGGEVQSSESHEYGDTKLQIKEKNILFTNMPEDTRVWMSHGDKIIKLPKGFTSIASTTNTKCAAFWNNRNIFAVQFHPEVSHSKESLVILHNFVFKICQAKKNWTMDNFIENKITDIKTTVGNNNVICAISGGVDSAVIATLISKAIGTQLFCVFVNNGLLRHNEVNQVLKTLEGISIKVIYADAESRFLEVLKDKIDPEEKRKAIGHEFIKIFEEEAKRIPNAKFLAQGTLYSDIIESATNSATSTVIKSHHNVGGLTKNMKLTLLEPAAELFKDEVRRLGVALKLPQAVLNRHPFPGPGLAIRIIGQVDKESLDILRKADEILIEELKNLKIYDEIWQAFCVLLPLKTVGLKGDKRTYEKVCAIRLVESIDGMTANAYNINFKYLTSISNRITNEVKGIGRVVYDISSKPPATIEWE